MRLIPFVLIGLLLLVQAELWAGKGGGESAKFWMNVVADLKNRGITDVFFIV